MSDIFPGTRLIGLAMSNDEWSRLQSGGALPISSAFYNRDGKLLIESKSYGTRAYLDRLFENASLRNAEAVASLKTADLAAALSRVQNAPIGMQFADIVPVKFVQQSIRSYLRGALFFLTRDTESSDYIRLNAHITLTNLITYELQILARVCRLLRVGSRSDYPTGGSHIETDRIFLSELLNFWRFRLGRTTEGQKWEGSNLVRFSREAFRIVCDRQIESQAMRQRLHRILPLMDKAEATTGDWNIIAKT